MRKNISRNLNLYVILITCFIFQSCSDSKPVQIAGAPEAAPITKLVIKKYHEQFDHINFSLNFEDNDKGFSKLCSGKANIINSSRKMSVTEMAECRKHGISYDHFIIGIDAIAIVVNNKNTTLNCINMRQVRDVWAEKERDQINTWNELANIDDHHEELEINLISPSNKHGDRIFFEHRALHHKHPTGGIKELKIRDNAKIIEDDEEFITAIDNDKFSMGFINTSIYLKNSDRLNAIAIENKYHHCVSPEMNNIQKSLYEDLSKPLLIYYNKNILSNEDVAKFLSFYKHNAHRAVKIIGYAPYLGE